MLLVICVLSVACRPSEDEAASQIARDLEASHAEVQDLLRSAEGLGHDEGQLLSQVERDRSILVQSESGIEAVRQTVSDLAERAAAESACDLSAQIVSGQQLSEADISSTLTNSLASAGIDLTFGDFAATLEKLRLAIDDIQNSSDPKLSALELELFACGHLSAP